MGGQSIVLEFWASMVLHRHSSLNAIYSVSFLLLLLFTSVAFGRPVNYGHAHRHGHGDEGVTRRASEITDGGGYEYLMRYGYISNSDMETGALRTDEELQHAVRKFQKMANITETGRLDPLTLEAMNMRRCGNADVKPGSDNRRLKDDHDDKPSDFNLGPSKWPKTAITVRIRNFTPDLPRQQVLDSIVRAYYVWSDVTPLTFHEIESGNADIEIMFASGYHQDGYRFDGPGMVLAHAFPPGEGRGGDLHFDEDEDWTYFTDKGTNLFTVAAHELGHSLGLYHSHQPGSLMYPWYQGYKPELKLHSDDIAGIQYLYGYKKTTDSSGRMTTQQPFRPPVTSSPTPKISPEPHSPPTAVAPKSPPTASAPKSPPVASDPKSPPVAGDPKSPPVAGAPNSPPMTGAPNPCDSVDAVSLIRGEMFLFSGKWFWRLGERGIVDGRPIEITRFWYGFPENVERIDAAFERSSDGKIIFLSGNQYWEFNDNNLAPEFSYAGKPISDFGFPQHVDHVDAVFVWGHNRRTYVIFNDIYWKLDDSEHKVETHGYPRDMSMWQGVELPVDAAFTHSDGHTYFFKGSEFWQFNNARMHVRKDYPKSIGDKWLKCKPGQSANDGPEGLNTTGRIGKADSPAHSTRNVLRRVEAHSSGGPINQVTFLFHAVELILLILASSAVMN